MPPETTAIGALSSFPLPQAERVRVAAASSAAAANVFLRIGKCPRCVNSGAHRGRVKPCGTAPRDARYALWNEGQAAVRRRLAKTP
ncbi:hypothetical protein GCM10010360_15740 [Streptomyces nogalater]